MLYPKIEEQCKILSAQFDVIPEKRRELLSRLAHYIQEQKNADTPIQLIFVCTHNSRRSHLGQVWSKVAAYFYQVKNVETFSAGTEATAMHANTIEALITQGFDIAGDVTLTNPIYTVKSGDAVESVCYSKTIMDENLPKSQFAAIMTCSDADENCPFIPGCDVRIPCTYEDPKKSDGTSLQLLTYQERSLQIARECLYVFSLIR